MQHINEFLTAYFGGSQVLWDVALGVLAAQTVVSALRFMVHLMRIYFHGEA